MRPPISKVEGGGSPDCDPTPRTFHRFHGQRQNNHAIAKTVSGIHSLAIGFPSCSPSGVSSLKPVGSFGGYQHRYKWPTSNFACHLSASSRDAVCGSSRSIHEVLRYFLAPNSRWAVTSTSNAPSRSTISVFSTRATPSTQKSFALTRQSSALISFPKRPSPSIISINPTRNDAISSPLASGLFGGDFRREAFGTLGWGFTIPRLSV